MSLQNLQLQFKSAIMWVGNYGYYLNSIIGLGSG